MGVHSAPKQPVGGRDRPSPATSRRAEVSFFGAHGHLPWVWHLLLAAVFGILLVALPGTARIVQLRVLGHRRLSRAAARPLTAPLAPSADDPPGQRTRR
jgi:hypothetical protein